MDTIDFVKQFPLRPFAKGEVLLCEGDTADLLLAIQTGYMKVSAITTDGTEQLLWIAGRYDVVPTERLFSTRECLRYFYTALSHGTAYHVPKTEFLAQASSTPTLMTQIARGMSQHHDELLERLHGGALLTVRDRLIAILGYIAQHFSVDTTLELHTIGLRLTHQELADMIGATRETTSLALQGLRKDKLIDYDRHHFTIYTERLLKAT